MAAAAASASPGYVFRPPRYRPLEDLLGVVEHSLEHSERVGLLGAAVADHPQLPELVTGAAELGGRVSISSLRVDNLRPEVLRVLAAGGTKTVTVAPEAGSERMREAINKGVSEEQVLRGAALVGEAALTRFKLYFMIGLPGEEEDDVHALAALGNRIKERLDAAGHGTRLVLSVSPLVPKPWTAYQYETQMPPEVIKARQGILKQHLTSGIELRSDSPQTARIDDVLSSARTAGSRGCWRRCRTARWGVTSARSASTDWTEARPWAGEAPPWHVVDVGMTERFLLREDGQARARAPHHRLPPAGGRLQALRGLLTDGHADPRGLPVLRRPERSPDPPAHAPRRREQHRQDLVPRRSACSAYDLRRSPADIRSLGDASRSRLQRGAVPPRKLRPDRQLPRGPGRPRQEFRDRAAVRGRPAHAETWAFVPTEVVAQGH